MRAREASGPVVLRREPKKNGGVDEVAFDPKGGPNPKYAVPRTIGIVQKRDDLAPQNERSGGHRAAPSGLSKVKFGEDFAGGKVQQILV